MPDFTNPFPGIEHRPMTPDELVRAIRLDLAAEQDATHLYTSHADATDNPLAKKVLTSIAGEERVHAGEFLRLLEILEKDETSLLTKGAMEVESEDTEVIAGTMLLLQSIPESEDMGGIVTDPGLAEVSTCFCTKVDDSELCHKKGIIGFLSHAEKAQYCASPVYKSNPGLEKRLREFKAAVAESQEEIQNIPKGQRLRPWLETMGRNLRKRGIEL